MNDAPILHSVSPNVASVLILNGTTRDFMIDYLDIDTPDSEISLTWLLNSVIADTDTTLYEFSEDIGSYTLEAVVSDSEFNVSRSWNVIVGDTSQFTCQEVGGDICSENEACLGDLIDVKDSSLCCSVACMPSFEDAGLCEASSSELVVDIDTPSENSKYRLGDTIIVRVEIDNDFSEDQDLTVEAYLYNLDSDNSEADASVDISIEEGKSGVARLEVTTPEDLDVDESYAIFVRVEDEVCNQDFINVDLERDDHKVIISKISMPSSVSCGESFTLKAITENIGLNTEDVTLSLTNSQLGINLKLDTFELEKYGEDDKAVKEFLVTVPQDAEAGEYDLSTKASYKTGLAAQTETLEVVCQSGQTNSASEENIIETANTGEIDLTPDNGASANSETSSQTPAPVLLVVLASVLLLAIAAGAAYYFLFVVRK